MAERMIDWVDSRRHSLRGLSVVIRGYTFLRCLLGSGSRLVQIDVGRSLAARLTTDSLLTKSVKA